MPTTSELLRAARQFAGREDGMVTIFACYMILIMLLVGGIGVDLMRHEMERTQLQAIADRASLAAADLDQPLEPDEVVADYFAKSGMSDYLAGVTISEGLNYRTVTVEATSKFKTQFMNTMGVDELVVPARSQAEEKVNKVEISLVVDISGSMANNNKMEELKAAAGTFIDTVLKPETEDLISISLVPYSEHVNAGNKLMSRLDVNKVHDYSYCIEFDDSDFSSVRLNTSKRYQQMQHFQWNYDGRNNEVQDTICPQYSYEEIIPLSQNATYLKSQINRMQPRAGTSIFLGMKWGAAMLDPSFRNINNSLVTAGDVDAPFYNRPVSYSDDETLKTVILMTDGQNDRSYRIADYYYDSSSEIVHWSRYNLWWYLNNYVSSRNRSSFYKAKYDAEIGDGLLYNICDAAKEKQIIIWSIGFEVTDHGASVMRNCASSPSHFFRVEGVEISEAFKAIARQINQLRLTQ
jgi:Flp pilus assembly protein TadG